MPATPALSSRAQSIGLSKIAQLVARAAQLRKQGKDVISLGFGEPDFDTPQNIQDAALTAMKGGDTRYTATGGTNELKWAIQQKFKNENGLDVDLDQIMVCVGAKHVIFNAFMATVEKGDEVIIPTPYWTSYPDIVKVAEGSPVFVECTAKTGFKLTPEALDAAITDKTKWLMLNSPSNPTGAVYSADEITALAEVIHKHPHVWILSDDIYEHIRFTDGPYATLAAIAPDLAERTLTMNGVSKAYAMTGWRIGYCCGPQALIKAMVAIQGQATSGANSMAQAAAVEALTGPQDFITQSRATFLKRRDHVVAWLNACPGLECQTPDGAFYAFPSCSGTFGKKTPQGKSIESVDDLASYLLDHHDVTIIPGTAFGSPGEFRISYAASLSILEEACKRIREGCEALS
ncbi:MAG: pyridoxal phosphate-dependent aminotransferase [Cohaesibacter sp.]|nr:pyridoxal phosphate-dependent aminotransferase [Cohaesibacter sp.]